VPSGINCAIVGYGRAGKWFHAYLVSKTDGLNLYAVSSRDAGRREQAEKDYGVRTYASVDELLKDDNVQLVILATPHDTHAELAIKCMNAGKHVVTDKIMCMNNREADAMIEASKKNNVLLSVFQNRRWDQDYLTVRKVIESGILGEVFLIESTVMTYGPTRGWRTEKSACGGQLFDWGAHLTDQAVQIAGCRAKTVYATAQFRKWQIEIDSHIRVHTVFESGLEFFIELSRLAKQPKPRWRVFGEEGTLVKFGIDTQERYLNMGRLEEAKDDPENYAKVSATINGIPVEMTVQTEKGDWFAYYRNISDVLNKGAELIVKPEDVRESVAIVEAAMKSVETGEVVKLS